MIAALFGLTPTALAILSAVCSPRLGICALHGQLFYFAALLLYSPIPLGVNALWLVPLFACLLFFCGTLLAAFIVRKDLNPEGQRTRIALTAALVLANFLLLLLLLHSVFDIMCFRLNEALQLPGVRLFTLILKTGSGALFIWWLACVLLRRARFGFTALYAEAALIFSTYIILIKSAGKVTWPMPAQLQRALSIRANMEYFTIASSAEFAQVLYFVPPVLAVLCGVLGYSLLKPMRKAPR